MFFAFPGIEPLMLGNVVLGGRGSGWESPVDGGTVLVVIDAVGTVNPKIGTRLQRGAYMRVLIV